MGSSSDAGHPDDGEAARAHGPIPGDVDAALQAAFGDDAPLYGDFQNVISGISSAVQGGLALVSVGPNLTWAQSHKSKDFEQRLASVDQDQDLAEHAQLIAQRDAAREAHRSGSADWHNIVLYIVNKRCFVYDPSALTMSTGSDTGKEMWRRLNADDPPRGGYDARMLVNVAPAARIWATGFSNAKGARFRKPANASGAWIGGGDNWATAEECGDCRGMCGNFIVLAHALQWAWQRGWAMSSGSRRPSISTGCLAVISRAAATVQRGNSSKCDGSRSECIDD
jgi:hypothetical protein